MSHDVHEVRSFEHPGEGRRRAKATPKGRQVDPQGRARRSPFCSVTGRGAATS